MFFGIVLMCQIGAVELSMNTCRLFKSPTVYETNELCVQSIQTFMASPQTQQMLTIGEIKRIECIEILPETVPSAQL
jgi:hypothetical protein